MDIGMLDFKQYLDYAVMLSFMWAGLACLVGGYIRKNFYWYTGAFVFCFLLLNRLFEYNVALSGWLISYNEKLIIAADKAAPNLLIYQGLPTWIMLLIGALVFFQIAYLISHLTYRKLSYVLGGFGLFSYIIAAGTYIFYMLYNAQIELNYAPVIAKDALLVLGSICLTVSFLTGIKPTKVSNYAENYD